MGKILIVGAGLTGAALARTLAEAGHRVTIIDERGHVAGHCHTRRDQGAGIMVRLHGAHITSIRTMSGSGISSTVSPLFTPTATGSKPPAKAGSILCRSTFLTINQFFEQALRVGERFGVLAA